MSRLSHNSQINPDDDIDDIMSQIIKGEPPRNIKRQPESKPTPRPASQSHSRRPRFNDHPITQTPAAAPQAAKKRRKRRNPLKVLLVPIVIGLGLTGGYLLYQGPVLQMLGLKSPFSKEIRAQNNFDLFYPTQLPKGFKINKESFTSPTQGVLVYSIVSDTSNITVSLQARPNGLDLSPLFKQYSGTGTIQTPVGDATVGVADKKTLIAHVLTEKTWMIINTNLNTLSREDFETILKHLKKG